MSEGTRRSWYEMRRDDVHTGVQAEVKRIRQQLAQQRTDVLCWMEMYAAGNVAGLGRMAHAQERLDLYAGDKSFNMTAALVDTAVSRIAQKPAIPMYTTTGGDYGLMRKARKKSQVLQGQMNELAPPVMRKAFTCAAKVGTGFVHDYIDDESGRVALRFVHPMQVLVEHVDGMHGKPRSIHFLDVRAKSLLKTYYPEAGYRIDQCGGISSDTKTELFLDAVTERSAFVEVWESWHLPAGKRDDGTWRHKGRHTLCIEGVTLVDEAWEDDELPFTPVRYRERDFGYYGSGIAERCEPNQRRVDEMIETNAKSQRLASTLVILNPNGKESVAPEKITNELGLILNFDGDVGAPTAVTWSGTLRDLQEQITLEFERAALVEGLSEQSINGEGASQGMTSGVAVRASDDVSASRLIAPIDLYQAACIAVAKRIAKRNDQLAKANRRYSVSAKTQQGRSTFLQTSTWAELDIPEGHAQVDMMPMSALPTTPQGKWAAVMEWIDGGFVDQQYAMQLLQFPDLDSYADTRLAHIDIAQWQVEQILDEKRAQPVPRQNLQVAVDIATRAELKAMTMSAPDHVIDAFEAFLRRCEEMIDEAVAENMKKQAMMAPPPPAAPGAGPPGAPPPPMPPGPPQGGPPGAGARPMQVAPQMRPRPMVSPVPA